MPSTSKPFYGRAAASILVACLITTPVARAENAPAPAAPPPATTTPPTPETTPAPPPAAEAKPATVDAKPVATDTTTAPAAEAKPAASAEAKPAEPPPPPPAPTNPKLDAAKALMLKKKYDDALKELAAAALLPDNTPALKNEIALTKMHALLVKKKPDVAGAKAIALEFLHADPDGAVFIDTAPEIRKVVNDIRETQPLVVHEAVTVSRPNRPWKVRASLLDRTGKATGLTLHYKPHGGPVFFVEPFKRETGGYAVLLKSPAAIAANGATDEFYLDYYISAEDAAGKVLDTNAPPEAPLAVHFSTAAADDADKLKGINLAIVENPLPPPAPVNTVKPAEVKPWYLRWYTLTGAGVVVVGATTAIVYAATRTTPLPANNGVLRLP